MRKPVVMHFVRGKKGIPRHSLLGGAGLCGGKLPSGVNKIMKKMSMPSISMPSMPSLPKVPPPKKLKPLKFKF